MNKHGINSSHKLISNRNNSFFERLTLLISEIKRVERILPIPGMEERAV